MNASKFHCISRQKNIYGSNYNIITFLDILYQFTNIYDELSILRLVGGLLFYINLSLLFKVGINIFSKIAENNIIYIIFIFFFFIDIFHQIIVPFQTFPITSFLILLSPFWHPFPFHWHFCMSPTRPILRNSYSPPWIIGGYIC